MAMTFATKVLIKRTTATKAKVTMTTVDTQQNQDDYSFILTSVQPRLAQL